MKIKKYLALTGIVTLVACSEQVKTADVKSDTPLSVDIEQAVSYGGSLQATYSGVVEARRTTPLSFATMGTVTEVLVEEGESVSKGQLLAKLNSASAADAYQIALLKQKQAEDAYRRLKPMKENGTLPEIKWVEVETGLNQAIAAVSLAQKNSQDCALYAPEEGVVGTKNLVPGMNVIPANTVADLLDIKSVYIKIPVSEDEISLFRKGDTATIQITALHSTLKGTIKEIGVSADLISHAYPVKIEVQNTGGAIKPGMICSVRVSVRDNRSGFLVSNKALQKAPDNTSFVFIENGGKAEKVSVQTLALIDNKVLVKGELPPGANVIVSGQQKLNNGSRVRTSR